MQSLQHLRGPTDWSVVSLHQSYLNRSRMFNSTYSSFKNSRLVKISASHNFRRRERSARRVPTDAISPSRHSRRSNRSASRSPADHVSVGHISSSKRSASRMPTDLISVNHDSRSRRSDSEEAYRYTQRRQGWIRRYTSTESENTVHRRARRKQEWKRRYRSIDSEEVHRQTRRKQEQQWRRYRSTDLEEDTCRDARRKQERQWRYTSSDSEKVHRHTHKKTHGKCHKLSRSKFLKNITVIFRSSLMFEWNIPNRAVWSKISVSCPTWQKPLVPLFYIVHVMLTYTRTCTQIRIKKTHCINLFWSLVTDPNMFQDFINLLQEGKCNVTLHGHYRPIGWSANYTK